MKLNVSDEMAEQIANDYLSKNNPDCWNGKGACPETFHANPIRYNIGRDDLALEVSFNQVEGSWDHRCDIVDSRNRYLIGYQGCGINSKQNLSVSIHDLCCTY